MKFDKELVIGVLTFYGPLIYIGVSYDFWLSLSLFLMATSHNIESH